MLADPVLAVLVPLHMSIASDAKFYKSCP